MAAPAASVGLADSFACALVFLEIRRPAGGVNQIFFSWDRRVCAISSIGGLRPPAATQRNFCLEPMSLYNSLPLLTSLARDS